MGMVMILFNKALMSSWGFPFPFAMTLWHCIFATLVTQLMVNFPQLFSFVPSEWNLFQSAREGKVTRQIFLTALVPLACFFAGGLTLGNSAYRYLSVAYIQMLKSLSPVCILIVSFLIGKEKPSIVQLSLVLMICIGVGLASSGEMHFSVVGFVLQVGAILSDVCRMTLIDVLMVDIKLDSLSMLYYLAPISSFLIFLGFLVFEYDPTTFPWSRVFDPSFGSILLVNGLCAICLNLTVFVAVANTSSVIIGVSGLVKDMLLVTSSVFLFGSPISTQQIVGYSISICGLTLYREYKSDPARMAGKLFDTVGRIRQVFVFATACCLGQGRRRAPGLVMPSSSTPASAEEDAESEPLLEIK